ncbi:MAG: hypothetical protein OPY05_00040 [Nitrosopumilus sp.]|nr:hypothetical protein [Nitrosopumilus sp.]
MALEFKRPTNYPNSSDFNYEKDGKTFCNNKKFLEAYATWRTTTEGIQFVEDIQDGKFDKRTSDIRDEINYQSYLAEKRQESNKLTGKDLFNYLGAIEFCKNHGYMQKETVQETLTRMGNKFPLQATGLETESSPLTTILSDDLL